MKRVPHFPATLDRGRRGFVLIIVMVIVAMVAFAGFAFVNTMSDEYRAVHTNGDLLAAEQALASAELMLLKSLEKTDAAPAGTFERSDTTPATVAELSDHPQRFREQRILPARPEEDVVDDPLAWRFSVVSPNRSLDVSSQESSGLRFGLENESARLHLSTLMRLDAIAPDRSRAVLMAFPGMTETVADGILDWLDADDETREFGAEAEDYRDRPNPYRPRNGLPPMLDELLLVRDVSRSFLLGPDENRNFTTDPHEESSPEQPGDLGAAEVDVELRQLGWADLMTLHSSERNTSRDGEPRIDLNDSSETRLREQLSAFLPSEVVDFIVLYRRFGSASGHRAGSQGVGAASPTSSALRFRVDSVADLIDASVSVTDGSASRVVPSPVTSSSRELLSDLLDRTTADARTVIPARINVNLASRPVLNAITGLNAELIEQILVRRSALDDEQLRTPAWLLTEQILNMEQFREVLPQVTTGGDVFRAQLIAWRPAGGPYRRVEIVIDGTVRPARRIVWNDLSAHGAAIPTSQLSVFEGLGGGPLP